MESKSNKQFVWNGYENYCGKSNQWLTTIYNEDGTMKFTGEQKENTLETK